MDFSPGRHHSTGCRDFDPRQPRLPIPCFHFSGPSAWRFGRSLRSPALAALLLFCCLVRGAFGDGMRIKDLVTIGGARDNQLHGFGLVVGLAGDGDKNPAYTVQTLANLLQRTGLTVRPPRSPPKMSRW